MPWPNIWFIMIIRIINMIYNAILSTANSNGDCGIQQHTDSRHVSASLDTILDHQWSLWKQMQLQTKNNG